MVVGVASSLMHFYFKSHALKLKIVGMAPSLRSSLRSLKAGPSNLFAARFCFKLSGVKWSPQTREYLVGSNDSLNSKFYKPFFP